jgi:hypothetical protein
VPASWIGAFLAIESTTVCVESRVLDPDRVLSHGDRMVRGDYERVLSDLSRNTPILDETRKGLLREATGLEGVTRWSWGGFNALVRSADGWFRECFRDYYTRSRLAGH